jgi:hypothetical protein
MRYCASRVAVEGQDELTASEGSETVSLTIVSLLGEEFNASMLEIYLPMRQPIRP